MSKSSGTDFALALIAMIAGATDTRTKGDLSAAMRDVDDAYHKAASQLL
jgi:hypothetical protein